MASSRRGLTRPDAWLAACGEPWTRYRTLVDLECLPADDSRVITARQAMVDSDAVRALVEFASEWPGYPLKRHNDAAHPLYAMATLADFGLRMGDPGIDELAGEVLSHFDGAGFESLLWLPRFLTKEDDAEGWTWMLCDAPTLLSFGCGSEPDVVAAVDDLVGRIDDNGWRCGAAESLNRFSGPGRKADPCPMATTYTLKALSLVPRASGERAVETGVGALLDHWEHQQDEKLRMFGIGTDLRRLKYPFVWYDLLHVADVLSRFEFARGDPRLSQMWTEIAVQGDGEGLFTAGSMYRAWKGWSFADKRVPSPWLTLLVHRIGERLGT